MTHISIFNGKTGAGFLKGMHSKLAQIAAFCDGMPETSTFESVNQPSVSINNEL